MGIVIRDAVRSDAPQIVQFIKDLASYEKLADEAQATAGDIERALFRAVAESVLPDRRI